MSGGVARPTVSQLIIVTALIVAVVIVSALAKTKTRIVATTRALTIIS